MSPSLTIPGIADFDHSEFRSLEPINDREALNEIFARNRSRLYKTALRLMRNHEDAEDALQDGLLSAYRNLSGFKGRSQLTTWLTRIVVNAALMRLRKKRAVIMISLDQPSAGDDRPLAAKIPDSKPNPEELYTRNERLQILDRAVQKLSPAYRQTFLLREVQGMSVKEASEASGVPSGSLKAQLHRARRRLTREVGHDGRTRMVRR
jgi:RNA polymerase sigma-70 factor, ECF subfamily